MNENEMIYRLEALANDCDSESDSIDGDSRADLIREAVQRFLALAAERDFVLARWREALVRERCWTLDFSRKVAEQAADAEIERTLRVWREARGQEGQ